MKLEQNSDLEMISKVKTVYIIVVSCLITVFFQMNLHSQVIWDSNAEVEEIVSGILQPEGPVWKEGVGLLFSDIKGNKIYKWTAEKGKEIYLDHSDSTNGLAYNLNGLLVAGQMGLRRIVRFELDGTQTSLADNYTGKKLNSPNDLVIKSDGSIFFTDPDFNIPNGQSKELDFNGIYRISPSGNLQHLATLSLPNGICFSPDETKLYVNDSQAHKIYAWDVVDDSTLANKKLLFTIPVFGYADGMKVDENGNIYCTCSNAVWIISPEGELIHKIDLPQNNSASNCAWGDDDLKTLYITAGRSVYKIRPIITEIEKQGSVLPKRIELYQNYPNPFNPSTVIKYNLIHSEKVKLKIFDVLGKEIQILVDEIKPQGQHSVTFHSANISSGVYFYQLTAGSFTLIKKLAVLK